MRPISRQWCIRAFLENLLSLSMIGAPPVAGFVTKWYLLNGAWDAHSLAIIGVLLISTLLNAAYFAPVVYQGFFGKPSVTEHDWRATRGRVCDEMVPAQWRLGCSYPGYHWRAAHQHLAECGLFRASGVSGLFWKTFCH